jgi:predicted nucleic acid-binding protein
MRPVLFDSSIYITALRARDDAALTARQVAPGSAVWLSAVVLEELYAGATERARHAVERLERDFGKVRRLLVPDLRDWTQAGKVLARLGARYDYERIGKARLTNDALIATSAGRAGITVITGNARDFARLDEFQPFSWRVSSSPES